MRTDEVINTLTLASGVLTQIADGERTMTIADLRELARKLAFYAEEFNYNGAAVYYP
jgi:hypothetical protein